MLTILLLMPPIAWLLLFVTLRLSRNPEAAFVFTLILTPILAAWLARRIRPHLARLREVPPAGLDDDLAAALALTKERIAAIARMRDDLPSDPDGLARSLAELQATMEARCAEVQRLRRAGESFNIEHVDAEVADYQGRLAAERDPAVAAEYMRILRTLEESIRDYRELTRLTQIAFAKVERIFHMVRSLELKVLRLRETMRDKGEETLRDEMEELAREIDGIIDALRELDRDGIPQLPEGDRP